MIRCTTIEHLTDQSSVAAVRRTVVNCAEALRFGETATGRAALVATELATNIIKHAGSGTIIIGSESEPVQQLILIALDKGVGIANVGRAMQDGYSTAGSPGTGLGAIRRGTNSMQLFSGTKGTVVCCAIDDEEAPARTGGTDAAEDSRAAPASAALDVAGICIAKSGETDSGDSWTAVERDPAATIAVADGLGHGTAAAAASSAFVGVVSEHADETLDEILTQAHAALRPTRGAAVGLARVNHGDGEVEFAGVGNIAATIVSDHEVRKTVSHPGIVGHEMRKVQTFSYDWTPASILVMQSDGIGTGWNFEEYPGITQQSAAVVAAVIYRDYCRGRDDATVVVVRTPPAAGARP